MEALLEEIDLFELDSVAQNPSRLIDLSLHDRPKPILTTDIFNEWKEFESARLAKNNSDTTVSCESERRPTSLTEAPVFTAEELIRRGTPTVKNDPKVARIGKIRSYSQDDKPVSQALLDFSEFDVQRSVPQSQFAVPPKLEHRKPALLPASNKVTNMEQKMNASSSLNGYIKHEPVGALIEVDGGEYATTRFQSDRTYGENDTSDSEESEDEVFHSGKRKVYPGSKAEDDLVLRKPLIGAPKKKGRILKGGVVGEMEMSLLGRNSSEYGESNGDPDDFSAMVKKGWSWKRRLMCLTYFLGANLFLGVAVCAIIFFTGNGSNIVRKLGFGRSLKVARCSRLNSEYSQNITTEKENIYIAGPLQIIRRAEKKGWYILVPYGSYSFRRDYAPFPGGVLAFYSGTMQKSWDYTAKSVGMISSLHCSQDVDLDGIFDCVLVTSNPASVEIFSGADGTRIAVWYPEGNERKFFSPQWIPDINGDGVADLLLTWEKEKLGGRDRDVMFTVFYSSRNQRRTVFRKYEDFFALTNASTPSSAALWIKGDSYSYVAVLLDKFPGISVWHFWSFLQTKFDERIKIADGRRFLGPIGKFCDLDGDGVPELVLCDQSGDLVAVSLVSRKEMWDYGLPGFKCQNSSIFFGSFNEDQWTDVGAVFQSDIDSKMVLLDGLTGKSLPGKNLSFLPVDNTVPLTIQIAPSVDKRAEDIVIFWQKNNNNFHLVALAPFAMNSSRLFVQDSVPPELSESGESSEALEVLKQRYSGAFFSNEGRVEYFLATNYLYSVEESSWRLMLHKIVVNCSCSDSACEGKFADSQPCSSEKLRNEDGCR